ncbi:hypothetical protein [Streptomyces pratensis]|uniref:hypothetical protein n=1 Tax=Streptomyces pratensis TaxID=1169025 RepID=UPI00301B600F
MRDHENVTAAGDENTRGPGRSPDRAAPGRQPELHLLQAGVGNAAVVQMLRQAGHRWAAAPEHRTGAEEDGAVSGTDAGPQTRTPATASPGSRPSTPVQRAIGIEVEVDRPVVRPNGEDVKAGNSTGIELMEHPGQGIKLVSDSRRGYTNAEFVAEPSAVLPGEEQRFPRTTAQTIDSLQDAHSRLYGPGADARPTDKQMRKIYPESEGYELTSGLKTARVAPEKLEPGQERRGREGMGDGLFVHQTVGLPLNGMAEVFAEAVQTDEPRNATRSKIRALQRSKAHHHLVRSVQVGNEVAQRFRDLAAEAGLTGHERELGAQELRGFGALCYTQFAALADKCRIDGPERGEMARGQVKNKTAVLSRVSLGTVQQSLPEIARRFLADQVETIRTGLWSHYYEVAPRTDASVPAISPEHLAELDAYVRDALQGTADFTPATDAEGAKGPQERAFGGMTELRGLDTPGGVPIVPLEFRAFGPSMASFDDLRNDVGLLETWSRTAFGQASNAREGRHRDFAPVEVNAPWSPPSQAAPPPSHEEQYRSSLTRCRALYEQGAGNPAVTALAPFLQLAMALAPRSESAEGPARAVAALASVMADTADGRPSVADVERVAADFTEWARAVGMPQLSRTVPATVASFRQKAGGA